MEIRISTGGLPRWACPIDCRAWRAFVAECSQLDQVEAAPSFSGTGPGGVPVDTKMGGPESEAPAGYEHWLALARKALDPVGQ